MKKIISGILALAGLLSLSATGFASTTETKPNNNKYTLNVKMLDVPINVKLPENDIELAITTYGNEKLDIGMTDVNLGGNVYSKPLTIENYSECPICVYETVSVRKVGTTNIMIKPDDDVNKDVKKNVKFFLSWSTTSATDTRRNDGVFREEKGDIMITTTANRTPNVLIPSIDAMDSGVPGKGYFKINGDAADLPQPYWDTTDGAVISLILKITPAKAD